MSNHISVLKYPQKTQVLDNQRYIHVRISQMQVNKPQGIAGQAKVSDTCKTVSDKPDLTGPDVVCAIVLHITVSYQ